MSNAVVSPSLTIVGMADYVTASAVRQRSVLMRFKYPKELAEHPAKYYADAYRFISEYYAGQYDAPWLMRKAADLQAMQGHRVEAEAKAKANAVVLRGFRRHFAKHVFQLIGCNS